MNVSVAEMRPIRIVPSDPEMAGLWDDLGRLAARVLPADWTLVGGLMVQLHAYEAGEMGVRVTTDIDILGDARKQKAIEKIARALDDDGFELEPPSPTDGVSHRQSTLDPRARRSGRPTRRPRPAPLADRGPHRARCATEREGAELAALLCGPAWLGGSCPDGSVSASKGAARTACLPSTRRMIDTPKVQTCPTPSHDTGKSSKNRIRSNRVKSSDATTLQNTPKIGS